MSIELIWERNCPHVNATRAALRAALEQAQRPLRWGEWDVDDALAPMHVRGYGSPTVLVDGRDVAGDAPAGAACCRLYTQPDGSRGGVPPVSLLAVALSEAAQSGWAGFPRIETERLVLTVAGPEDAAATLAYFERNRAHLGPWEPARAATFYDAAFWADRLGVQREEFLDDESACFVARQRGGQDVVAVANLRNFVRGSFQACHLGYSVDAAFQGQGVMSEALRAVIDFAFTELRLHRVMANYVPDNERSARLLERLGFEREGYARKYLKIAGEWRDHVLTARIDEREP